MSNVIIGGWIISTFKKKRIEEAIQETNGGSLEEIREKLKNLKVDASDNIINAVIKNFREEEEKE